MNGTSLKSRMARVKKAKQTVREKFMSKKPFPVLEKLSSPMWKGEFYMLNKVKRLIGSLIFYIIFIILTTQAGAAMNSLTAVRLGKVDAGEEKTKEEGMEKRNIAAP